MRQVPSKSKTGTLLNQRTKTNLIESIDLDSMMDDIIYNVTVKKKIQTKRKKMQIIKLFQQK